VPPDRLAVVGTGLIGASVGLAAKRVGVPEVVGWDADDASLRVAAERGAVDSAAGSLAEAVEGADIVYADVWVSMGDDHSEEKLAAFAPYQVNEALMAHAPNAHFMHCLPAHRGEEVSAGVMDGPGSAVWRQAENRMHTARGAMLWMMEQA